MISPYRLIKTTACICHGKDPVVSATVWKTFADVQRRVSELYASICLPVKRQGAAVRSGRQESGHESIGSFSPWP
jgi:hypothetical protein